MSNDNIVSLVPPDKQDIPESEYVIVTHADANNPEGREYFATGFLLFTSHHVAIMRDTGLGALPILVVPLANVLMAEIVEPDEDETAPF